MKAVSKHTNVLCLCVLLTVLAIGMGLSADHPTDIDGNCITGFGDLAVMATKWLNGNALTEPVAQ